LVFAGLTPFTQEGELPGSRTEFIHWIQDGRDQRGILRNYVKYDNEIHTGKNVKQLVHRALQLARSEPAGPVYLVGAREVMQEPVAPFGIMVLSTRQRSANGGPRPSPGTGVPSPAGRRRSSPRTA
jgi:acetolactate synthase-1/2/3 large subunit